MGTDSALPVLSRKNKTLYSYFKQLFAQVTNPPIDPIREELVMSLVSFVGPKPNLLNTADINPPIRLEVSQPVLTKGDIEKLRHIGKYTSGKFSSIELDICYPSPGAKLALKRDWPRWLPMLKMPCVQVRISLSFPIARLMLIMLRSPPCWPLLRFTSIWSSRACAQAPVLSLRQARLVKHITLRCSVGMGPKRFTLSGA
jgi:hypothetical protein